jgi:hypothetical protein
MELTRQRRLIAGPPRRSFTQAVQIGTDHLFYELLETIAWFPRTTP